MRQRAIFEHMHAARNQVSCDAAKRDWQIIKALHHRIRQPNSIQDEFDLLPRIETSRKPGELRANRNVWSAALSQAKNENDRMVCANVFGLRWSTKLLALMECAA